MPIIMVGKLFENTWFTSFVDLCEIVSRYIFAKAKMRGLVEVDRVGGLARSGGGFGDRGGGLWRQHFYPEIIWLFDGFSLPLHRKKNMIIETKTIRSPHWHFQGVCQVLPKF